jgi:hypothetical protein
MRSLVLPWFVVMVTAAGSLGQTCERTLTVNGWMGMPPGLGVTDFEAVLDHHKLTITRVEPLASSRVLILILAADKLLDQPSKHLVQWLEAMNSVPPNITLAYGVYAEKIVFSSRFTSDPQELRSSLAELVTKANSGVLGRRDAGLYLFHQALDFFQKPQAGDSIVVVNRAYIDDYDDYSYAAQKLHMEPISPVPFLEKGIRFVAWGLMYTWGWGFYPKGYFP